MRLLMTPMMLSRRLIGRGTRRSRDETHIRRYSGCTSLRSPPRAQVAVTPQRHDAQEWKGGTASGERMMSHTNPFHASPYRPDSTFALERSQEQLVRSQQ